MSTRKQAVCIGLAIAGAMMALPEVSVAQNMDPLDQRQGAYAPWSPDQMAQRRKDYGLIGPGTNKPVPPPAFPDT